MQKKAKFQFPDVSPWTANELALHKQAVHRLEKILAAATARVARARAIDEEQLYHFMLQKMLQAGLTSMLNWIIVAYGPSAADPHYRFKAGRSRRILPGHFLLLDIWGKLNRPDAPYADITHTYFVGKNPPARFQKLWADLREARDLALARIRNLCTSPGAALHEVAKGRLDRGGHVGLFLHGLGHDLGHDHVHGPGVNLSPKFNCPLLTGRGYTIEPGIYKQGDFGLRSEMDFYFDKNRKVQVTTRLQKKLECI
ncbi:aminopeptidase P family protein [Candidatus Uhrbacteria bacterium]|nr:aminopeptidase P family protein [Candidatus Uhrbacteria bacterium]